MLPEGVTPELSRVQGTDAAEIGVFADEATGTVIVICAIDNLGKGAAGQAVQNANLALGLAETPGCGSHGVAGTERSRRADMGVRRVGGVARRRTRAARRRATSRSSAR